MGDNSAVVLCAIFFFILYTDITYGQYPLRNIPGFNKDYDTSIYEAIPYPQQVIIRRQVSQPTAEFNGENLQMPQEYNYQPQVPYVRNLPYPQYKIEASGNIPVYGSLAPRIEPSATAFSTLQTFPTRMPNVNLRLFSGTFPIVRSVFQSIKNFVLYFVSLLTGDATTKGLQLLATSLNNVLEAIKKRYTAIALLLENIFLKMGNIPIIGLFFRITWSMLSFFVNLPKSFFQFIQDLLTNLTIKAISAGSRVLMTAIH